MQLASLIQFTMPGAPTVYYGDEVGLSGGGDPDNRRTFPWGSEDFDLLAHYQALIGIRNAHPALRGGELLTLLVDDGNKLYSYIRYDASETIVVVLNNGDNATTATVPVADFLLDGTGLVDLIGGGNYTVSGGSITVSNLAGKWGVILYTATVSQPTATYTSTPTATLTNTPGPATATFTASPTEQFTRTPTATATPTVTNTATPRPTRTITPTLAPGETLKTFISIIRK